jgi:catechol 2,3-dioxygenase-like lactoylglutathione lyase family enzyme
MATATEFLSTYLEPLAEDLTPQQAQKILAVKPTDKLVARIQVLGDKAEAGTLTEQERSEWFEAQRQRIREQYLRPADERSASSARGLHHTALVSSDVEQTVRFYQDLLEFPLTELIENRDYAGSSHFFFDIGNDNLLAFFDFPGLDQGPYQEVLGGLHHLAISVEPSRWERLRDKLTAAGVEFAGKTGRSSPPP